VNQFQVGHGRDTPRQHGPQPGGGTRMAALKTLNFLEPERGVILNLYGRLPDNYD
jgi:hypothetical protein